MIEKQIFRPQLLGGGLLPMATIKTRRVFFSFHYQKDIFRVNTVRNHDVVKRNFGDDAGYHDNSLWEEAKKKGPANIQKMIDDGLNGASVTCILIGNETWSRYWCQYEVLKSIEQRMGVFGVRIHKVKCAKAGTTAIAGPNPFDYLGFFHEGGKFGPAVYEENKWKAHDRVGNVIPSKAPYLPKKGVKLSNHLAVYDWVSDNGYENFPAWADTAAKQAGR